MRKTATTSFDARGLPGTGLYHTTNFDMAQVSKDKYSGERITAALNRRAFVNRMFS